MAQMNGLNCAPGDFKLLFVDDETDILSVVQEYLSRQGYSVTVADNGIRALDLIRQMDFDILITDLNMPELDGIGLLTAAKEIKPEIEVVIVTGFGTIESAIEALKLGCYDYLQKPIKLERLKRLVDRIIEKKGLQKENVRLKSRLSERLVGKSSQMKKIFEIIDRISLNSPTVLIQGESGTGKEVVARVIHQQSDRSAKPFIAVNCGAIVEGLLESELFGHVKGAFTGAVGEKMGLFEAAHGGTIFLDEVAEINPSVQVKLLRVLQEKKIRPVGSTEETEVNARVIAATNRNLDEAVKSGALRKDLYYRLNVVSIKLPPLAERREDIPLLVSHFMEKVSERSKKKILNMSPDAMDVLENYHWPGNVRQLENVIERAFALGVDETIRISDLPSEIRGSERTGKGRSYSHNLQENEIALIRKALEDTGNRKAEAARLLGIDASTLYRKIKKYGI